MSTPTSSSSLSSSSLSSSSSSSSLSSSSTSSTCPSSSSSSSPSSFDSSVSSSSSSSSGYLPVRRPAKGASSRAFVMNRVPTEDNNLSLSHTSQSQLTTQSHEHSVFITPQPSNEQQDALPMHGVINPFLQEVIDRKEDYVRARSPTALLLHQNALKRRKIGIAGNAVANADNTTEDQTSQHTQTQTTQTNSTLVDSYSTTAAAASTEAATALLSTSDVSNQADSPSSTSQTDLHSHELSSLPVMFPSIIDSIDHTSPPIRSNTSSPILVPKALSHVQAQALKDGDLSSDVLGSTSSTFTSSVSPTNLPVMWPMSEKAMSIRAESLRQGISQTSRAHSPRPSLIVNADADPRELLTNKYRKLAAQNQTLRRLAQAQQGNNNNNVTSVDTATTTGTSSSSNSELPFNPNAQESFSSSSSSSPSSSPSPSSSSCSSRDGSPSISSAMSDVDVNGVSPLPLSHNDSTRPSFSEMAVGERRMGSPLPKLHLARKHSASRPDDLERAASPFPINSQPLVPSSRATSYQSSISYVDVPKHDSSHATSAVSESNTASSEKKADKVSNDPANSTSTDSASSGHMLHLKQFQQLSNQLNTDVSSDEKQGGCSPPDSQQLHSLQDSLSSIVGNEQPLNQNHGDHVHSCSSHSTTLSSSGNSVSSLLLNRPLKRISASQSKHNFNPDVLLVEDVTISQKIASAALSRIKYRVEVASDGETAVELFRQHRASLKIVLMDISLPGMSGIEATEKIRKIERESFEALEQEQQQMNTQHQSHNPVESSTQSSDSSSIPMSTTSPSPLPAAIKVPPNPPQYSPSLSFRPVLIYGLTSSVDDDSLHAYSVAGMNGCIVKGKLLVDALRSAVEASEKYPNSFINLARRESDTVILDPTSPRSPRSPGSAHSPGSTPSPSLPNSPLPSSKSMQTTSLSPLPTFNGHDNSVSSSTSSSSTSQAPAALSPVLSSTTVPIIHSTFLPRPNSPLVPLRNVDHLNELKVSQNSGVRHPLTLRPKVSSGLSTSHSMIDELVHTSIDETVSPLRAENVELPHHALITDVYPVVETHDHHLDATIGSSHVPIHIHSPRAILSSSSSPSAILTRLSSTGESIHVAPSPRAMIASRRPDILLVEDVHISQRLSSAQLKKMNYIVEVASDGEEAVRKFQTYQDSLQIILMDINLPGMSGLEATEQIRRLESASHASSSVLIIGLTGNTDTDSLHAYEGAGLNGCIPKGTFLPKALQKALQVLKDNPRQFAELRS